MDCEGGVVFVLVRRSRKVVYDELLTLMSWDYTDFLIFLVMVCDVVLAFSVYFLSTQNIIE